MLEKLKDYVLERHIRNLLEKYYSQFGLTLDEAKKMNIYQLLYKIEKHLEANAKQEIDKEYVKAPGDYYIQKDDKLTKVNNNYYVKNSENKLEDRIKKSVKENSDQFGFTKEDIEKMSTEEILKNIGDRLKNADKEFNYYANVVNHLEERLEKITIENKEFKQRVIDLKGENKGLHNELAKVREDNYNLKLENSIYKQRFNSNEATKTNETKLEIAK